MKKNSGITLISLVLTIVIIGMLANIAVYATLQSIEFMSENKYTTQMRVVEEKVNIIYKEIQLESATYDDKGIALEALNSDLQSKATEAFRFNGISDGSGYRYFDKNELARIGIKDIDIEVLINFDLPHVIALDPYILQTNVDAQ